MRPLLPAIKRVLLPLTLVLGACLLLAGPARAWGPLGHRIISQLAEPLLQGETRRAMAGIIGDESLAEAATWADEMRGDPSDFWQHRAGPLHYVTVPPGLDYARVGPPDQGDAVTGLRAFGQLLREPQTTLASRQLALRFAIHIVQDLHQPLHVGNGRDRGGTRVEVRFRGRELSLHRLWDTELLTAGGWSEQDWVRHLSQRLTPANLAAWSDADPLTWIAESARLRESIYPATATVDEAYIGRHREQLELRLAQAAVRTAAWLNSLYSPAGAGPAN